MRIKDYKGFKLSFYNIFNLLKYILSLQTYFYELKDGAW